MWEPGWPDDPQPSFFTPIPDPGTDPDQGPFVYIAVNQKWQPLLAGAAMQLCLPSTWDMPLGPGLQDMLARATILVNLIGEATGAVPPAFGTETLVIEPGQSEASVLVTFDGPFTAPPQVFVTPVGSSNPGFPSYVSENNFLLTVRRPTPLRTPGSFNISWRAFPTDTPSPD